jgi:hypothetical protein
MRTVYYGGIQVNPEAKATTRKPVKSTIALFQSLRKGSLCRKDIEQILWVVNGGTLEGAKNHSKGYLTCMLGYNLLTGRFNKVRKGRYVYYSLTQKGIEYAKTRELFA